MSSSAELKAALDAIRHGLAAGRVAHAYLVVGEPRGQAGQFADELLALLYCSSSGARPCRKCPGCRQAGRRSHPDLLWVEPQKKSRTIQTEQVEDIQRRVFQTALEGGWKAVVLVHAERLNEVAANKLLKTLEEPPARCIFLLLSAKPEYLPATIVSRCQRVALSGETADDEAGMKAAVLEIVTAQMEPGALGALARAQKFLELFKALREQAKAEENATVAAELLAQIGVMDANGASGRADANTATARKEMEAALEARIEGKYREQRAAAIRWLLFWQRDLLLCVCGLGAGELYFRDAESKIRAAAATLTYRQALNNIRVVEEMKDQLEQALPEAMVLERGMAELTSDTA